MPYIMFVSVKQSFEPGMDLAQLEPWVASAWAISVEKAFMADRVVAVLDGEPLAAWPFEAPFPRTRRISCPQAIRVPGSVCRSAVRCQCPDLPTGV